MRTIRSFLPIYLFVLLAMVPGAVRAQDFTSSPDGPDPNPLIRDAQGNLYGITASGASWVAQQAKRAVERSMKSTAMAITPFFISSWEGPTGDFPYPV
jgi:hypothetical protein